ncbi:MAG: hypothetical protein COB17_10420 [Sulfurimonas sp.]|nr:MAG: hypothetical protein COB17_10420 [Sulfurimonas sp.]
MPEFSILFENSINSINAISNGELIKQLKSLGEEKPMVKIMKDGISFEYQVKYSEIEKDDSYILSFSDITAIHDFSFKDKHTQLPMKNSILEKIESYKNRLNTLNIIIEIKNLNNVDKWYGNKVAINIEIKLSDIVKKITNNYMQNSFIDHFDYNKFIIIPANDNLNTFYEKIENISLPFRYLLKEYSKSEIKLNLSVKSKLEYLSIENDLVNVEVDLENMFSIM